MDRTERPGSGAGAVPRRTDPGEPWDFPLSDFADNPYFHNQADEIVLDIYGDLLPINDFLLTGTFAAAGSNFGGGTLSGLGDTRYLGGLILQPDNENAICELAADVGAPCTNCNDGAPFCLNVILEDVEGTLVEGLTLTPSN